VKSQEVEEVEFFWLRRSRLTILVTLRSIFLLTDLLIAAEILRTQCFIICYLLLCLANNHKSKVQK